MTIQTNFIKLKERQREGLQRDIELYLKNGGKIDHIPTGLSAIADGRVHNGHVVYSCMSKRSHHVLMPAKTVVAPCTHECRNGHAASS